MKPALAFPLNTIRSHVDRFVWPARRLEAGPLSFEVVTAIGRGGGGYVTGTLSIRSGTEDGRGHLESVTDREHMRGHRVVTMTRIENEPAGLRTASAWRSRTVMNDGQGQPVGPAFEESSTPGGLRADGPLVVGCTLAWLVDRGLWPQLPEPFDWLDHAAAVKGGNRFRGAVGHDLRTEGAGERRVDLLWMHGRGNVPWCFVLDRHANLLAMVAGIEAYVRTETTR